MLSDGDDRTELRDEDEGYSLGERVLLDLHRSRRRMGEGFARRDPTADFELKRARMNAILEIARAVRNEGEGVQPTTRSET